MIKPIETVYNGFRFRSRLESRWAVFFDTVGVKYEYEPEGFDLGDAGWYLPDFYIPERNVWVEIKPALLHEEFKPSQRLYLAGRMDDWREGFDPKWHTVLGPKTQMTITNHKDSLSFSTTCYVGDLERKHVTLEAVCERIAQYNMEAIQEADVLVVWIDSLEAHGTLLEMGYARALGKTIYLYIHDSLATDEWVMGHGLGHAGPLWMAESFSDYVIACDSPPKTLSFSKYTDDEVKLARLSQVSKDTRTVLIHGPPMRDGYHTSVFYDGECAMHHVVDWHVLASTMGYPRSRRDALLGYEAAMQARFEHGETPAVGAW